MAEFKKEQLIDHIRDMMESSKEMIDGNGVPVEFVVRAERDIAVYEIALAALTAGTGPVAYMYRDKLHSDARFSLEKRFGNWSQEDINEYQITEIPLYAAPQLPQPAVPDEMPEPDTARMFFTDAVVAIARAQGWNACRAAMLQSPTTIQTAPDLDLLPKSEEVPTTIKPVADLYSIAIPGGHSVIDSGSPDREGK